jgi:hypothetical protein
MDSGAYLVILFYFMFMCLKYQNGLPFSDTAEMNWQAGTAFCEHYAFPCGKSAKASMREELH